MAEELAPKKKRRKYPDNPVVYLAKLVHDTTQGGRALLEFMMDVHNGKVAGATVRDRLDATKYLIDRGYGKAAQQVEVRGTVQHTITAKYDLSKLSNEELVQMQATLRRAAIAALPAAEVEDAEIVPDDAE